MRTDDGSYVRPLPYPSRIRTDETGIQVNGISMPVDGGLSSSHPVVLGQAF
jgi:hypothetical protein